MASHAPWPEALYMNRWCCGLQHALHAGERRVVDLDEIRIVEVDRRPVDRAQHAVGNVGRARDWRRTGGRGAS